LSETFEEFKNSFSYGTRTDLSFKFLKSLSNEDASKFFSELLDEVGGLFDGEPTDSVIDLVYRWQVKAYTPKPGAKRNYVYDDRPFTPLGKELSDTTVGLVTSSGHFAADDPPSDSRAHLQQHETITQIGEYLRNAPDLSEIRTGTASEDIIVRHPGYDVRSAERDHGVAFPMDALSRAALGGRIGRLAEYGYSFVGACSQGRLRKELDGWISRWRQAGVEALFLVPV